jgi:hypothetical protein
MSLIIMEGCHITDTMFTLDARITGEEICWNVTRLQRDAEHGRFGDPWRIPMANLPPMTDADRSNIDWKKVDMFVEWPMVLGIPLIAIGSPKGPDHIFCFVDGHHRLSARQLRGMADFDTWVVPVDIEKQYRITTTKIG